MGQVERGRAPAGGHGGSRAAAASTKEGLPVADGRGLVLACSFAAKHPGSFIASQLAVARAARERLGLDVVFVLPDRARRRSPWIPEITDAGFETEFMPASAWSRPSTLLRIARDARAAIIHSHFTWFDLDALYAGRRANAAVIWHVRSGIFDYPFRQRLTDQVKCRLLARGCAAVLGVSDQVGRDLLRRGVPADKVRIVLNALVLERFTQASASRLEVRKQLGIPEDAFVVLAHSWPPVRKGTDVLFEGARSAEASLRGRLRLVLVGEQPAAVQQFLLDRFDPLPEWLSIVPTVDDVVSLLHAVDVFVSAAREDAFSFAIAEALACGLPVVGSDIPGTSHFWSAPGFVRYPVEEPQMLAQHLCHLTTNGAGELGGANRRWALEHLAMERHVDEMIECYRVLLGGRSARR